ncbi:MAG: hypothetical protein K6U04_08710 [Armatimonadetes bacterium]|nr:hypothetical protein [Armatimonadota bacterium]
MNDLSTGVGWKASLESIRKIYLAREYNTVLKCRVFNYGKLNGEPCLIIYIPNNKDGVMGFLPESRAGLRQGEKLEDLMRDPYIHIVPEEINRREGTCILNREKALRIASKRAWRKISEGSVVEVMVKKVRRDENKRVYEVVCDVEGITAIMPVGEISHRYIKDVKWRRGELIQAKVLKKKETEGKRELVISRKALRVDPLSRIETGQKYAGVVTHTGKKTHVLVGDDIDGIDGTEVICDAREVKRGEKVLVKIVSIAGRTVYGRLEG